MLTFRLTPYRDLGWRWNTTTAEYVTADRASHLAPLPHPLLEHTAWTDGHRTLLTVRERLTGRHMPCPSVATVTPQEYDLQRRLAAEWPAMFLIIETAPLVPVAVCASPRHVVPVFLAADAGSLYGSWDMADLRTHAAGLNPREAARLLIYRPRYAADTVFRGIHRLTERAAAVYGGALDLRYPAPALHPQPGELDEPADVLGAFVAGIDAGLDRLPLDPDSTTMHLTAGFDSGTVATRAAERWPGRFATGALLIDGPGRAQQQRRRNELRERVSFADQDDLVDAVEFPPLHPDCARVRGEPISPYEEPLLYPFEELTRRIAARGTRAVVTGLGGDEMVAVSHDEHDHPAMTMAGTVPWLGPRARAAVEYGDDAIAPPAPINSMTLLSLETSAPPLLRAGIWPVHPFAEPAMVTLGERLPYDWRELKQLQRRRLRQLGCSEEVVWPSERESFAEVVETSLRRWGVGLLQGMLEGGSPLIEEGLVDPDGLRTAVARLVDGPYDEDVDAKLLQVTTLHLAAEAYC